MGKLYDIMAKAKADRDIEAFNRCYHDDWEFKFHSSGRIVRRGDNTDEQTLERWDTFKVESDRCLYENEDILVTHSIVHFPNGSTDAVMMVHIKKTGYFGVLRQAPHRCQRSKQTSRRRSSYVSSAFQSPKMSC